MLQKLFHVNICVRDMERSIRFYQDPGFTKVEKISPLTIRASATRLA
jgi:catechol 2,3-dioxygenase-like lactoylglutathione lyase family enzyme